MVWIYRSLFQLPRDVEDVRGGDEHDAESDGGVPSPVFRVREPPAVGGPDLRGVEPTTTTAHVCVRVTRSVSSSARVVFVRIKTDQRFWPRCFLRKEFCRGNFHSFFCRVYYLGFVFFRSFFFFLFSFFFRRKEEKERSDSLSTLLCT